MHTTRWLIAIAVAIIGFAYVVNTSDQRTTAPDATLACIMARDFVKPRLKSPNTAKFTSPTSPACTASADDNVWHVLSYVDAQNGFGAMLRTHYYVQMHYDPASELWSLLDIDIAGP